MTSDHSHADPDLLQKLLLGQLPSAQVDELAAACAEDRRVAEVAESLAGSDDTLLNLLRNQDTVVSPEDERLVERLQERLQANLSASPLEATADLDPQTVKSTTSPVPDLQQPTLPLHLEYYQPLKILGQGGMGTVYLALDTRLGREVALKTLRPELAADHQAKERFLREARTAAKLSHDHLIPIFYVGEAAGTPFLAMPLLKGESLEALVKRTGGPLPVAQCVRIARETASGLAAAHDAGLIHRDIKPPNLWLEAPVGRVKILDFGLAKAANPGSDAESETQLTSCGSIVGTPAYMAPEQARGHAIDGRADLFSLGCVLYELLTGKRPFSGPDTMAILMSLAAHTPPAPHTLNAACPVTLSQLVMQLLEKNPVNRPASAHAVIQALSEVDIAPVLVDQTQPQASREASAPGVPSSTTSCLPTTRPAAARPPRNHARRIALALGGAMLLLFAFVVYRIQTDQGTLVVTIEDPAVQVLLEKEGLVIRDKESDRSWTITTALTKTLPSGKYQVEGQSNLHLQVTDDSGAELTMDSFTLQKNKVVRVTVTLEPAIARIENNAMQAADIDADRRAAEYVLSVGGNVVMNVDDVAIGCADLRELPKAAFRLTGIELHGCTQVSTAGLAACRGCEHLTQLQITLSGPVGDAGLEPFHQCKKLTHLGLRGTNVTNAGLAYFNGCRELAFLHLHEGNGVTNRGLANFKDCEKLEGLDLAHLQMTAKGLDYFQDCSDLQSLNISNTTLGDEALAVLKRYPKLTALTFANYSAVSNAGLTGLDGLKDLKFLTLSATQVDDAGVEQLQKLSALTDLRVFGAKLTAAGIADLSAALPSCRIEWDGGVIEPRPSPDR